jgi:hypothetical protein
MSGPPSLSHKGPALTVVLRGMQWARPSPEWWPLAERCALSLPSEPSADEDQSGASPVALGCPAQVTLTAEKQRASPRRHTRLRFVQSGSVRGVRRRARSLGGSRGRRTYCLRGPGERVSEPAGRGSRPLLFRPFSAPHPHRGPIAADGPAVAIQQLRYQRSDRRDDAPPLDALVVVAGGHPSSA